MREYKSFFKKVTGNEGEKCRHFIRLDTYGCGCSHNCSYCYAKSLLDFRKLWNPNNPSVADIGKIEKTIKALHPYSLIRLGGMTDCFQPCEEKYSITYETIKLLNQYKIQYLIVTKADLVASEKYMRVMDTGLAHIQISVTSTNDNFAATYEQAVVPSLRIAAIEKLENAGFDVQIRLSPFIEEFFDFDILNSIKCDKAIVEFLRINPFIKRWFNIDYTKYTHSENGYMHLPLNEKIKLLKRITGFKDISICEDCTEAYEYWKKHFNPNALDCCNLRF